MLLPRGGGGGDVRWVLLWRLPYAPVCDMGYCTAASCEVGGAGCCLIIHTYMYCVVHVLITYGCGVM
jgi:hypothetical protein